MVIKTELTRPQFQATHFAGLLRSVFLCIFGGCPVVAHASGFSPWKAVVTPTYQISFPVLNPKAQAVREHFDVEIPFRVTVKPGPGGASPMEDIVVCLATGSCKVFDKIKAPANISGTFWTQAPSADNPLVTFVVCKTVRVGTAHQCGDVRARAEAPVNVFARYRVFISAFKVIHTRARTNDTIHVTLAGGTNGSDLADASECNRSGKLGAIFCKSRGQGDVQDGSHKVTEVGIGPFDFVPNRHEFSLDFAFALTNYGAPLVSFYPDVDHKVIEAARDAFRSLHPGQTASFVDAMNDHFWEGCDGPTAAQAISLLNMKSLAPNIATIEERTRATGQFTEETTIYRVKSQVGCGDDSRYTVTWGVRRESWRSEP